MLKHNGFSYYDAFKRQAGYAEEMVMNLASAIEAGELGSRELVDALHAIEGDADEANHAIQSHLLGDFVVPMERGGMVALAHALDDVCDGIEQVAIDAYTRKLEIDAGSAPGDIVGLVSCLKGGVSSLCNAVSLLRTFDKNRDRIREHCVRAQSFESRADELYIASARKLYEDEALDDRACRIRHDLLDLSQQLGALCLLGEHHAVAVFRSILEQGVGPCRASSVLVDGVRCGR